VCKRRVDIVQNIWVIIQLIFSTIGSAIAWFLGGCDALLLVLVALVSVDYLTGCLRAVFEKKLSSNIGWRGIAKKVMTFAVIGMAHIVGYYIINDNGVIRNMAIFFYISNEGLSILENASSIGVPLPYKFKNLLLQLRGDNGRE